MENFLNVIVSQLKSFWNGMDAASRTRMIISAVLILAIASTVTWFLTRQEYVALYSGLDAKEAGEIFAKLEEQKMDPQVVGTGTIKVPKKHEAAAKMQLAVEGYPKSSSGSDYFQNGMGLGATDFDKRMAEKLQLQDRLQSAIKTMDGVRDSIVTLSMPEQNSFVLKEDRKEPTASVLLVLKNDSLGKQQVKGIEQLVAKSVAGLKPENISIVDNDGNALNSSDDSGAGAISNQFELETQLKDTLQKQVVSLLAPVFGKKNVMASVNVHLNFDKKIVDTVQFSPVQDGEGITVSINELKEAVSNSQATADATGQGSGDYTNTNKTINYEVNQTKGQIEEAQGKIEALTMSVLINKPDLDDQMKSDIRELVQKAVGVDDSANIVVSGMAFDGLQKEIDKGEVAEKKVNSDNLMKNIMDIGTKVALILLILFVLFIIYRFVSNLNVSNKPAPTTASSINATVPLARLIEDTIEIPEEDQEHIIKKQRIDNLIDNKPDVVAQQIKDWLNEN